MSSRLRLKALIEPPADNPRQRFGQQIALELISEIYEAEWPKGSIKNLPRSGKLDECEPAAGRIVNGSCRILPVKRSCRCIAKRDGGQRQHQRRAPGAGGYSGHGIRSLIRRKRCRAD